MRPRSWTEWSVDDHVEEAQFLADVARDRPPPGRACWLAEADLHVRLAQMKTQRERSGK